MSDTDLELLARYARHRSSRRNPMEAEAEDAFAEIVRRHLDLVHSAALRQVRSPQLAVEVAQSTFLKLAQHARQLAPDTLLSAWLYQVTRREAIDVVRREARRQLREQIATEMNAMNATAADSSRRNPIEADWTHIEPLLDEAMHALDETDRAAVLLRYFENKSLREVGEALGASENAAQKRLTRAVERLREFFARRGVSVGASGLTVVISANAVQAAPVGLAFGICKAALASGATTGGVFNILKLMASTKLKVGAALVIVLTAGTLILLLSPKGQNLHVGPNLATEAPSVLPVVPVKVLKPARALTLASKDQNSPVKPTAKAIVAGKLKQFGKNRRDLLHSLARRLNVSVPDDIEKFFDAVERGKWEEIDAAHRVLLAPGQGDNAPRSPEIHQLWRAVQETWGIAREAHNWPAQVLLDYGEATLGSLKPGMVYLGGTDPGCFIPTFLNETKGTEPHITLTQNALVDDTYLTYLDHLYGDRLETLSKEDSRQVYERYLADAQSRFEHDEKFPDEPPQIRPGEDVRMVDGKVQVTGPTCVMAVNEGLLQRLMEKNPQLSFALQESFPLSGTYADASPLGPLMELRSQQTENPFTPDQAEQSLAYWRDRMQKVLSDPEASESDWVRKAYAHDLGSAANLLATHNFGAEAEQIYGLARQLSPEKPEPLAGLAMLLNQSGRAREAHQLLADFYQAHPAARSEVERLLWMLASPSAR